MNRKSKRFTPGRMGTYLVPVALAVIFLGLLATLIVVFVTSTGL
jgi:hypothetical protein